MLSKEQFNTIVLIAESGISMSQYEMSSILGCSVEAIDKLLCELSGKGLIRGQSLTDKGFAILEDFRVKRAVFMAAGLGARLAPVTHKTPKPLVKINGKRIIDTLLDAVTAIGITEIYVVRGHLSEQFDQLLRKYPTVRFIENPEYAECNNISSAVRVREHMNNAYVMDADLYLKNPGLITKYQYSSNYLGVPVDKTDDWCLLQKNDRINGISLGGEHCHIWIGISYWTEKDGLRLSDDIERVYQTLEGKAKYWDQVPLECCKDYYDVFIRECSFEDIIEIDTLSELKALEMACAT